MAIIDGLVSYWKMDDASGAIVDAHGGNDGTNDGAGYGATGIIEDALDFEVSETDTVDINAIVIPTSGDFTISVWVKPESKLADSIIVGQNAGGAGRAGLGAFGTSNFLPYFSHNPAARLDATTTMDTGTWYHLVVKRDSGTTSIWVNGSSEGSQADSGAIESTDTFIGAVSATTLNFDGLIDEVGIWSSALSQADIEALYNSGAGLAYPFTVAAAGNSQMMGANF